MTKSQSESNQNSLPSNEKSVKTLSHQGFQSSNEISEKKNIIYRL